VRLGEPLTVPHALGWFSFLCFILFLRGKWKPWTDRIQGFDIPKDAAYHTIVVPTTDTERNQFMIRTLIERNFNVIFSGSTGTAKTASINGMLLGGFNPDKYCVISFAFSAQTTENQCADIIDGTLDKLCYPAEKGLR